MNQETLKELFTDQIRDLYSAEQQLVKALPKIAKATTSPDLTTALKSHLEETKTHVERLTQVFGILGLAPKSKKCKAMEGLLAEGDEAVEDEKPGELRDLALIAGCQRVEHYEISAYGTAKAIAGRLGLDDAVALLQQTEDEESSADSKLTEVAGMIYDSVEDASEEDEMDEEPAVPVAKSAASKSSTRSKAKS